MDKHQLFLKWFPLKEQKHATAKCQKITNGEVWWVAVGENVGIEINGKSDYFSRPVLVYKKLSHLGFMGIPLTTKNHEGAWYVGFSFQHKEVQAVLSQARVFSALRLYNRLGQLAEDDMEKIKNGFRNIYF